MEFLQDELQLKNGVALATVSPWGACLTQLLVGDLQVITHASRRDVQNSFAGVTLAPWPNRLANGSWSFEGKNLSTAALDEKENANHGLVFDRKFELIETSDSKAVFRLALGEDKVYPFPLEFTVSYHLDHDELVCEITAKNLGVEKAPVAFGSHPYIQVDAESLVTVSAANQSINNEFQIPVGFKSAETISQKRFQDLNLDDCFFDLKRDSLGLARATIEHQSGEIIELWQDSTFEYLMIYTHPTLGIALEPQTAPANALNSGEGLIWLGAGESVSGTWGIRVSSGK